MVGTEMCLRCSHKALRHHSACGRTKSPRQRNPTRKARKTKGVAATTSVASLVVDREEKSAWFLFDHSGNNCCFVWLGLGKIFVYLLVFLMEGWGKRLWWGRPDKQGTGILNLKLHQDLHKSLNFSLLYLLHLSNGARPVLSVTPKCV